MESDETKYNTNPTKAVSPTFTQISDEKKKIQIKTQIIVV